MAIPFTSTETPSSGSYRESSVRPPVTPRTPSTSQSLKHRMSSIFNTPKRMSKRHNVPPPLAINELTPPATIKRMTCYDPNDEKPTLQASLLSSNAGGVDSFEMLQSTLSLNTQTLANMSQSSLSHNTECSICEDSLRLRNGHRERVIVLSCDHSCHWDCFLIGGDSKTGMTVCFECGGVHRSVKDDDLREIVLQELRNSALQQLDSEVNDNIEEDVAPDDTVQQSQSQTSATAASTASAPSVAVTIDGVSPHTPVNQIIRDEDILNKKETYPEISRDSFIDGPSATTTSNNRSGGEVKMKNYAVGDLIKPEVNLLTEYSKYDCSIHQDTQEIGCLLNIFTNDGLKDQAMRKDQAKEKEVNQDIHKYFVSLLSHKLGVEAAEALNLPRLPQLSLFDSFDISIDGEKWEKTVNFLFGDSLVMFNDSLTHVIGTVLISEHLISLILVSDSVLVLYLSTQALPELQIRSSNKVLLDRWSRQLQNLTNDVSLIKMSTTLWSLIIHEGSQINLPTNVIKFNELTHSGLDLPFEMVKEILPAPEKMGLNLVVTVPLFNMTELSDDQYLDELRDTLLNIIDNLKPEDKLGFVILGRDGAGNIGVYNSTYIGMIDKNYDGLWNLMSGLQLSDIWEYAQADEEIDISKVMAGCFKSCYNMFLMNGVDGGSFGTVNKLMVLTNVSVDYELDNNYLTRLITQHDLSINEILISQCPTLPLTLKDQLIDGVLHQSYCQLQFQSFKDFNDSVYQLFNQQYHSNYLNCIDLDLRVTELFKSAVSISKIEINGVITELTQDSSNGVKALKIKTTELTSQSWDKNIRFDLSIDLEKYQELAYNESEISLLNVNFTINNSEQTYHIPDHKIRINITDKPNIMDASLNDITIPAYSPITIEPSSRKLNLDSNHTTEEEDPYATEDEAEDEDLDAEKDLIFLDIPLLPPLSSFKDSIYIKRCIELYLISELQNRASRPLDLHRMISVVWGLSKGCSSNYLNYWNSRPMGSFDKYIEVGIMKQLKRILGIQDDEGIMDSGVFEVEVLKFVNVLIGC
ncbi:hypothetical protein WICPIJ_007547 [Wickerhamomyces pijperi]|uniref:Uncharacterized protein n=1 Tax=Wickerhamomyces pijperi TaxID=599730 RepID=A0A9P8TJ44_WICPI|nr:hypothetical protein WICPIJ_007547 [Wickerhamomyces pijperi]